MRRKKIIFLAASMLLCNKLGASEPLYIANLPNIHEYELFANNGWTGNWYVGYDHCWITELPPAPEKKNFKKAFIGVKLGRAKSLKQLKAGIQGEIDALSQKLAEAAPAEKANLTAEIESLKKKSPENAKIIIAVSDNADFSGRKSYLAALNSEIPLEGDNSEALNNVGESRWFWTEVPMSAISAEKTNFVAAWSDNPLFASVSYAPVIAAGWSEKNKYAYLSTDNFGKAPKNPEKKISFFTPALCIRLVPDNKQIFKVSVLKAEINDGVLRVQANIEGEPERLRLRVFDDNGEVSTGFGISTPPWHITAHNLEKGRYSFELDAEDRFGNRAESGKKTFAVE
ncbi:MAG: hypothetical protein COS41_00365 [Elusimicrobia bacterium CG03_land_8_20_14_0_80_50_18]|nr:MAG: hypothetical protein COS41_00365 [Elusimicrobia bacterium CG03_land_8_20_14_0_80_50_18]PIX14746.1 MAG: hypothetical protein COZ72_05390 [Elusimicrobia bacterium CG_4_8_14_3_um_filter_50_9]